MWAFEEKSLSSRRLLGDRSRQNMGWIRTLVTGRDTKEKLCGNPSFIPAINPGQPTLLPPFSWKVRACAQELGVVQKAMSPGAGLRSRVSNLKTPSWLPRPPLLTQMTGLQSGSKKFTLTPEAEQAGTDVLNEATRSTMCTAEAPERD